MPGRAVVDLRVGAIEYFVGTDSVSAAVIDADGASRLVQLCHVDDVLPHAHRLLDALEGPSTPKERDRLLHAFVSDWGRRLVPPAGELARFDVVVLIPHHTLHALPLHAAWIGDSETPLVERCAVSYCASATLFRRCVDRNAAREADGRAWIVGGADTPASNAPPVPSLCAGIGVDALGAKHEDYQALARLFGSYFAKHLGPEMTRLGVKRPYDPEIGKPRPETYDAVYFVCHGYVDRVRPVSSGLVVDALLPGTMKRPIRLPGDRYYLFRDLPFRELPREIEPRPGCLAEMMTIGELQVEGFTDAQLVALLGCSTGAGHVLSGDAMESIAYQWLRLGAASVLASLWRLDIEFIAAWVPVFLRQWLELRHPKAMAWREATLAMRGSPTPPTLYQWAGLQLLGDWL